VRSALLSLVIAPLLSVGASAQNLLANGDFSNASLTSWTCTPPTKCGYDGFDVGGAPLSGSAVLVTDISAFSDVELDQCVAVSASTSYDFGGFGFVPLSNSVDTILRIKMAWFEQPGCVTHIYSEVLAVAHEINTWTPMTRTRPSPPNAVSGRFLVEFLKSPSAEGVVAAYVDELFVPEPEAGWGGGAALGALAAVSRRALRTSSPARPR
jgi:hypothetical protein